MRTYPFFHLILCTSILLSGCSGNPPGEELSPPEISLQPASFYQFPDARYFDLDRCPTGDLLSGTYPPGSNYNGMTVLAFLTPEQYVKTIAIPAAHPGATGLVVKEVTGFRLLAMEGESSGEKMENGNMNPANARLADTGTSTFQGALVTVCYTENDTNYNEKFHCLIEDFGEMGAGMWASRNTWSVRTPDILSPLHEPTKK